MYGQANPSLSGDVSLAALLQGLSSEGVVVGMSCGFFHSAVVMRSDNIE